MLTNSIFIDPNSTFLSPYMKCFINIFFGHVLSTTTKVPQPQMSFFVESIGR